MNLQCALTPKATCTLIFSPLVSTKNIQTWVQWEQYKLFFTIISTLFINNIYYTMTYSLFLNLLGIKYNTTTSSDLKLPQINWNANSTATWNCKTVAKLEAAWLYPFLLIFNITKLRETANISWRFCQMSWFKLQVNIQTYNWNHYKTSITF